MGKKSSYTRQVGPVGTSQGHLLQPPAEGRIVPDDQTRRVPVETDLENMQE